jgi:hypothetical protein
MSVRSFIILFSLFAAFVTVSSGDTFLLKSGDRVEGHATNENEEIITVQRYVGDSAPLSIARNDLQEILPDTQETAEYLTIIDSADIKTAVGPDVFNQLIDRKIPAFESKYPQTKYRPDLDRLSNQLNRDKARQAGGAVKIAGIWLTHDQVDQEKYQVSAALLHESMEYSAAIGDWPTALNAFQNLRVNYQGSRAYVEGIGLAVEILPRFRAVLEEKLQGYRLELLRAYLNSDGASDSVRENMSAAPRRESEQIQASINEQRRNGVRWPTIYPQSEKDFTEVNDQITEELATLSKLPVSRYRESIDAANRAQQAASGHDPDTAKTLLNQAQSAWPENEMIGRIAAAISAEEKVKEMRASVARANLKAAQTAQASEMLPATKYRIALFTGIALLFMGVCGWIALRRTKRSRRRFVG